MRKSVPWAQIAACPRHGGISLGVTYFVEGLGDVWLPPRLVEVVEVNPPENVCLVLLSGGTSPERTAWMVLDTAEEK